MMKMRWDDTLERFAQDWASGCRHGVRSESQRSGVGEYVVVGENIYVTTEEDELPVAAVSSWIAEKDNYDYEGNECRGACGFYQAVVWAETRFLGCGLKYCPNLQGSPSPGYYVVCDYGPAADPGDRRPFKKGDPCLDCPEDARDCVHELCYDQSTWSPGENLATRLTVNCITVAVSFLIKVQITFV
ncbi:unnamed protein product [Lymnaea stagnalis]|uniref:SCP domain-containing protein n=1 Tax=Lymnaea stagnalis TaxID=6523 RepID=A0AAV2IUT9_LYMST